MNKLSLLGAALVLAGAQSAHAALISYNVTTTWYEPETQPYDSIFTGTFVFDTVAKTVSNLQGTLTESMTGGPGVPATELTLSYQLSSVYDASLGGLLVTTFRNNNTNTFWNMGGTTDGWSPAAGVAVGGVYSGFPVAANNPGNAYARIFVNTTDPTTALTQGQIDKLAYADCAPGGMMGAVCMTGTSVAGYGAIGTMSGYPVSQTITPSAVPVPAAAWFFGSALLGFGAVGRHRKSA